MGTIICGIAGTISTFVPCEDKIISFDEYFDSNYKENAISVWDWDGWHEILVWFDNEGNVIKID